MSRLREEVGKREEDLVRLEEKQARERKELLSKEKDTLAELREEVGE